MATVLRRAKLSASRMKKVALTHRPASGAFPSNAVRLEQVAFRSQAEYQAWEQPSWVNTPVVGWCALCDQVVDFIVSEHKIVKDGVVMTNWREELVCPHCLMCNRVRAALQIGIQDFGLTPDTRIYVTEQFGMVYRWLRGHFDHVVGSEYLEGEAALKLLGINHQDVQALSLPGGSVDCIISFDVLEHVPDPQAAFRSFARVLAPGGRLIMTAPFDIAKYDTTVRAELVDGEIVHHLPVEMHGNPLDPEGGSLCFRHFGWDTLDQLRDAGFRDAWVHVYHDPELGYLGGPQAMFSAVK